MTSLIDVIFLLLLFFMLSSTFTRFSEVELAAAGAARAETASDIRPFFLRLGVDSLDLNGRSIALEGVGEGFGEEEEPVVLVSLLPSVTAQRLTDLLVALQGVPGAKVTVLGHS
jgi:biopolymer transport protein ExbD